MLATNLDPLGSNDSASTGFWLLKVNTVIEAGVEVVSLHVHIQEVNRNPGTFGGYKFVLAVLVVSRIIGVVGRGYIYSNMNIYWFLLATFVRLWVLPERLVPNLTTQQSTPSQQGPLGQVYSLGCHARGLGQVGYVASNSILNLTLPSLLSEENFSVSAPLAVTG